MTAAMLSPSRPRFRLGLALAISALLHGGAVAMARLHGPASAVDFSTDWKKLPAVEVELEENPVPPEPPLELPDLLPPLIPDDPPMFTDTLPPPISPQPTKLSPISKKPPQPTGGRKTPSARALALHAPLPEYPYEARRARIVGDGVAILKVDSATGRVIDVAMAQSTGSAALDRAAIAGLQRWRFRPGAPSRMRCPITYTLTGAMF